MGLHHRLALWLSDVWDEVANCRTYRRIRAARRQHYEQCLREIERDRDRGPQAHEHYDADRAAAFQRRMEHEARLWQVRYFLREARGWSAGERDGRHGQVHYQEPEVVSRAERV